MKDSRSVSLKVDVGSTSFCFVLMESSVDSSKRKKLVNPFVLAAYLRSVGLHGSCNNVP